MQLIYGKKSFMFDVILVGKSNFSQSAQGRKYCNKHFCNTCEKEFEGSPKIDFNGTAFLLLSSSISYKPLPPIIPIILFELKQLYNV